MTRRNAGILYGAILAVVLAASGWYLLVGRRQPEAGLVTSPGSNPLRRPSEVSIIVYVDNQKAIGDVHFGAKECASQTGGVDGFFRCKVTSSGVISIGPMTYVHKESGVSYVISRVPSEGEGGFSLQSGELLTLRARVTSSTGAVSLDRFLDGAWVAVEDQVLL